MAMVAVRFGLGTIVATGLVAGVIFAAFEMFAGRAVPGARILFRRRNRVDVGSRAASGGRPNVVRHFGTWNKVLM